MTSILRKIGGLEAVEVVDPPPVDYKIPQFPPNPPAPSPLIPSPLIPGWSMGSFMPLNDESVPRPTPDGNARVPIDEDWVMVYFPPNPLIAGDTERWVRYKKSDYDRLVSLGVLP
jgi:hypothetical protein